MLPTSYPSWAELAIHQRPGDALLARTRPVVSFIERP